MVPLRKAAVAGALCAVLLAGPAPVLAAVTISVEVAYGSVVVGGVGFFLYVAGSWEVPFAGRDVPTSLLEVGEGRVRLGVPIPRLTLGSGAVDDPGSGDSVQVDLLRWRF